MWQILHSVLYQHHLGSFNCLDGSANYPDEHLNSNLDHNQKKSPSTNSSSFKFHHQLPHDSTKSSLCCLQTTTVAFEQANSS